MLLHKVYSHPSLKAGASDSCPHARSLMVMNKITRHQAGLKPCSYDPLCSLRRSCRPLGLLSTVQQALLDYLVNDHQAAVLKNKRTGRESVARRPHYSGETYE